MTTPLDAIPETAPPNNDHNLNDSDFHQSSGFLSHHSDGSADEGGHAHNSTCNKKLRKDILADTDDKAVTYLRLVVLLLLLGAAVAVSVSIYLYLARAERYDFERQYDSDATKLLYAIGRTLDNTFGPLDALIVNLVATARVQYQQTNVTFPFVVLPSYGLQAAKLLKISKAFNFQVAVKVEPDQLEDWKAWIADHNQAAIDEALDVLEGDPDWHGLVHRNYSQCPDVYTWGGAPIQEPVNPEAVNFFAVNWMEYPIMGGASGNGGCPYNYDHMSLAEAAMAVQFMMGQQKGVIGNFPNINFDETDPMQALQKKILGDWTKQFVPPEDAEDPVTQIGLPIFDTVESIYVNTTARQTFVGYMALNIHFRAWIENALPQESEGVIIVADQGACGFPFTYRIDGAEATYLGKGDFHDSKYDDMVHTAILETLMDEYTGVPVSADFCPITLRVYPSQDMEDIHVTHNPIIMTAAAICIFAFTSVVFIIYDTLVSRRQSIVMNRALESGAIVSSLFPEEIRNKLYEENKQKFEQDEKRKNFLRTSDNNNNGDGGDRQQPDTNQIAKLYPETTIFFADLAGFTSWSAQRQPSEVFKLLETLYGAFDKLADRRKVFKVETIGDCYVAITGCPAPQSHHAVIMVKFARDCMSKMIELTKELAETLGDDTATLGFRVGLHSGPVTAGVLRGQKARFQLFGDSVNTAARMESNGIKGKIHVSQATADSLTESGKGSWLVAREDKIMAKGKGLMQTYFVYVKTTSREGSVMAASELGFGEQPVYDDVAAA